MKIGESVDALYNDAWYRGIVQQVGGHINLKKKCWLYYQINRWYNHLFT